MVDLIKLVAQCRQHDSRAQRELYELYKARLMGVCRRYASSRDEAQDILQEVFIKIFTKLDQLDSSERLEGWMLRIAVNTSINFYRNNKRIFQDVSELETDNGDHEIMLSKISDDYLVKFINELPAGSRIVFNLFVVEGYNHAEIGKMLRITESTSRSQLVYAKKILKEKLNSVGVMYYERYA